MVKWLKFVAFWNKTSCMIVLNEQDVRDRAISFTDCSFWIVANRILRASIRRARFVIIWTCSIHIRSCSVKKRHSIISATDPICAKLVHFHCLKCWELITTTSCLVVVAHLLFMKVVAAIHIRAAYIQTVTAEGIPIKSRCIHVSVPLRANCWLNNPNIRKGWLLPVISQLGNVLCTMNCISRDHSFFGDQHSTKRHEWSY